MTDLNRALETCTQIEADYRTGKLTLGEALHELVWTDAPAQVRFDFIDQIAARLIEEEQGDEHFYTTGQDDYPDDYYEEEEHDAHVDTYHEWRRTADQDMHIEAWRRYGIWSRVAAAATAKMNGQQWDT